MTLPARLSRYLDQRAAYFEVIAHSHSRSSAETARAAHVQPRLLAKSVILEDDAGCVMAVVPADRSVKVGELAQLLGRHDLHLSDEARIASLFDGCERGAVPPVGMAWGLETIVDDELAQREVVYLEGGDHCQLLRMSQADFEALMRDARHAHFCKAPMH